MSRPTGAAAAVLVDPESSLKLSQTIRDVQTNTHGVAAEAAEASQAEKEAVRIALEEQRQQLAEKFKEVDSVDENTLRAVELDNVDAALENLEENVTGLQSMVFKRNSGNSQAGRQAQPMARGSAKQRLDAIKSSGAVTKGPPMFGGRASRAQHGRGRTRGGRRGRG